MPTIFQPYMIWYLQLQSAYLHLGCANFLYTPSSLLHTILKIFLKQSIADFICIRMINQISFPITDIIISPPVLIIHLIHHFLNKGIFHINKAKCHFQVCLHQYRLPHDLGKITPMIALCIILK